MMPVIPNSRLSLIIKRLNSASTGKRYAAMTINALSHLREMNGSLLTSMRQVFFEDADQKHANFDATIGVALLNSYETSFKLSNDEFIDPILKKLATISVQMSTNELARTLNCLTKLPLSKQEKHHYTDKFLPVVLAQASNFQPGHLSTIIIALFQLGSSQTANRMIDEISQTFHTASVKELWYLLTSVYRFAAIPSATESFLWQKLASDPEHMKLKASEVLRVLTSRHFDPKVAKSNIWLLNILANDAQRLSQSQMFRLFLRLAPHAAFRSHILFDDIIQYFQKTFTSVPIDQLYLSISIILRTSDASFSMNLKVALLKHLYANFDEFPEALNESLIDHLIKYCQIPELRQLRDKLYLAIEKRMFLNFRPLNSSTSKTDSLLLKERCMALRKLCQLRESIGLQPTRIMHRILKNALQFNLDTESIVALFSTLHCVCAEGPKSFSVSKALSEKLPSIASELTFGMCCDIILPSSLIPLRAIDLESLGFVIKRLVTMMRKDGGHTYFTINDLFSLARSNILYKFVAKHEWDHLLLSQILRNFAMESPTPHLFAKAISNIKDSEIYLSRSHVANVVEKLLDLRPSSETTPGDVKSLIRFVLSDVEKDSIHTVLKHILTLSENYKKFSLHDLNYILDALKTCNCDHSILAPKLVTFFYTETFSTIEGGDLYMLFELAPFFNIDTKLIAHNLLARSTLHTPNWLQSADARDLVLVLDAAMANKDLVHGSFIGAVMNRVKQIFNQASGTDIIRILFAVLHLTVIHGKSEKPLIVHKMIDAVSLKSGDVSLRDIVLFVKAVQISAHVYKHSLPEQLVNRFVSILNEEQNINIIDINKAIYGLHRIGLESAGVFEKGWNIVLGVLASASCPHSLPPHKLVDRFLHTMMTTKLVHAGVVKHLVQMIPTFDESRVTFSVASRLYNSCTKLAIIDKSLIDLEVLDKLKNLCMLKVFISPSPLNSLFFAEATSLRAKKLHTSFDEESVSAIIVLTYRVFGMDHHLTRHCVGEIFQHLRCLDIYPDELKCLSEKGKVRFLVDSGYITSSQVSKFIETYASYSRKSISHADAILGKSLCA